MWTQDPILNRPKTPDPMTQMNTSKHDYHKVLTGSLVSGIRGGNGNEFKSKFSSKLSTQCKSHLQLCVFFTIFHHHLLLQFQLVMDKNEFHDEK